MKLLLFTAFMAIALVGITAVVSPNTGAVSGVALQLHNVRTGNFQALSPGSTGLNIRCAPCEAFFRKLMTPSPGGQVPQPGRCTVCESMAQTSTSVAAKQKELAEKAAQLVQSVRK